MTANAAPQLDDHGLLVRPVTADRWAELAEFFGPSGAYAHCWCTFFRQSGTQFTEGCRSGGIGNRTLLQHLTLAGSVPGLTAHRADGRPVGWVSVAPRTEFPRVLRSAGLRPGYAPDPGAWSIVCFWVPARYRGRGVARALLHGAVHHAAAAGATVVEGYPLGGHGRVPDAQAYHGTEALFVGCGFTVVFRPERGRRVVVRRAP